MTKFYLLAMLISPDGLTVKEVVKVNVPTIEACFAMEQFARNKKGEFVAAQCIVEKEI